jgi:hypothetical protein
MLRLPARTWMPQRRECPPAGSHSPPKAHTVHLIGTSPLSSATMGAGNRGAIESCASFYRKLGTGTNRSWPGHPQCELGGQCRIDRLWWVDLIRGVCSVDPFSDQPKHHFVELQKGSVLPKLAGMHGGDSVAGLVPGV